LARKRAVECFYVEEARLFHLEILDMATNQVDSGGSFEHEGVAIAAAFGVIDDFLRSHFTQGMSAQGLYSIYESAGRVPFIFKDHGSTVNVRGFNHINYARNRSRQIAVESAAVPPS
jgi:hypothetical protein